MLLAIPLGTVRGIPIRVDLLFLALVGFLALTPGFGPVRLAVVGLLALSVVLHELGHSLVAQRLGIRVLDITLWPLGGLARLSHVPESSGIEAKIAIAGPAVNGVLAALATPLWLALVLTLGPESVATSIAGWFLAINLFMGAFNLIPAFPTDGGRLLRAWLARRRDWLTATRAAVSVGRFVSAALFGFGALHGEWMLCLVAVWLWFTGGQELALVRARHARAPFAPPAGPPGPDGSERSGYAPDEIQRLERFRGPLRQYDPE
jgi:Zn-dependent protease